MNPRIIKGKIDSLFFSAGNLLNVYNNPQRRGWRLERKAKHQRLHHYEVRLWPLSCEALGKLVTSQNAPLLFFLNLENRVMTELILHKVALENK